MATSQARRRAAVQNVILACFQMFTAGLIYALGVFSPFVEDAANPQGSLDGVWSAAMGLISLVCVPLMFFTGVYLSEGSGHHGQGPGFAVSKTDRLRVLSFVGCLCYAMHVLAGYGVDNGSAFLVRLAFSFLGAGCGIFYVAALEMLAAWMPQHPGLAVGFGQMAFGLGSISGSSIFSMMTQSFSCVTAVYITAVILSLPMAFITPFLEWPPHEFSITAHTEETFPLLAKGVPLSWRQLMFIPAFWIYVVTIFSAQFGYAFYPYYFKIGLTFGESMEKLVSAFQVANLISTIGRPLTGVLVDNMKTKRGFLSMGSKNVMLSLLVIQMVSFSFLIPISAYSSFAGFVIASTAALAVFAAGSCCAPLLPREQFGATNSAVVFGVGGSISMGLGEAAAVFMMAAVESLERDTSKPSSYQSYYAVSVLWSIVGLFSCLVLAKYEQPHVDGRPTMKTTRGELGDVETLRISGLCDGAV